MPTHPKMSDEVLVGKLRSLAAASAEKVANLDAMNPTPAWQPTVEQGDVFDTIGDVGIKAAQGVVGLGQAAVGLGSLATGGLVGRGMKAIGYRPEELNAMMGEHLSASQKAADAKVQQAEGFVNTLKASLENPRSILGSVAESAPGMVGIMGVTGAVARNIGARAALAATEGMAGDAAVIAQVGQKAAQKAVEEASTKLMLTGAGAEGAQTAGQIAEQAQAAGRDYTDYALPALAAGASTAAIGMVSNKIFGDAATDIATGTRTLKGSKLAKLGKEAFSEGVMEELPQSAQEQVFTNMAMGESDLTKGVGNAAASGLLAGAAMGVGMGSLHRSENQAATQQVKVKAAETFTQAAETNDVSAYVDPKSPTYDPSTAIGALLKHAQSDTATPEVKSANVKQAGELLSTLEEDHAAAQEAVDARSDKNVQLAKDQLAAVQEKLKTVDPTNTAVVGALKKMVSNYQADIAELTDSKKTMVANTKFSRLDRQLTEGRARMDALTSTADPVTATSVDEEVAKVKAGESPERLINLSMRSTSAMTGDQAAELANDKTLSLTDEQRTHLRSFSAARVAENVVSTTTKVAADVMIGSSKNVGLAEYRKRIGAALASGTQSTAVRQLTQLSSFADSHADKLTKVQAALATGEAAQVVRVGKDWTVVTDSKAFLPAKQLTLNGGLDVHPVSSTKLAENMVKEVTALRATTAEMASAVSLKFGKNPLVQNQDAAVQSIPPANTPAPASPASLFREKREREGRVEEDKSSSPVQTPGPVVQGTQTTPVAPAADAAKPVVMASPAAQAKMYEAIAQRENYLQNPPDDHTTERTEKIIAWAHEALSRVTEAKKNVEPNSDAALALSDHTTSLNRVIKEGTRQIEADGKIEQATNPKPAKTAAAQQPARTSAASTAPVADAATSEAVAGKTEQNTSVTPATLATPASPSPASLAVADAPAATVPAASSEPAVAASPDAAVEEGAGVIAAVNVKAEQGDKATYQQKRLGDFFSQVKEAPLASIKDMLTGLTSAGRALKLLGLAQLSGQQILALKTFRETAQSWLPAVTANLVDRKMPLFAYNDMAQHFIGPDGKVEENVKTALTYAAYSYAAETAGSHQYNTNEQINELLERDKDEEVYKHERMLLGEVIAYQSTIIASLGKRAVEALGLKAKPDTPVSEMTRLENALGAHALRLLVDGEQSMFERVIVSKGELAAIMVKPETDEQIQARLELESKRTPEEQKRLDAIEEKKADPVFLKVRRFKKGENKGKSMPLAQTIVTATRGSENVVNKLFKVEAGPIAPTFVPVKQSKGMLRRTQQKVPAMLLRVLNALNKQENFLRQDKFALLNAMGDTAFLKTQGWVEVNEQTMHADELEAIDAKNAGLERELDNMKEFIESHLAATGDGIDSPFFFEHYAQSQQRVGIANNMVNPQASKIHRFMIFRKSWPTTVKLTNAGQMENFWLRAAEGMGVKTDKNAKEKALAEIAAIYDKPQVQAALKAMLKVEAKQELTEADTAAIVEAADIGGEKAHSLDALAGLAQYYKAQQTKGATSFDVNMIAEVDGVTNGPMLSHLLMGAATTIPRLFELLNRGGFYESGSSLKQFNQYRSLAGSKDLYEKTARSLLDNLRTLSKRGADGKPPKVNSFEVDAVTKFMGKLEDLTSGDILKDGRNMIKTPLTSVMFGSALKKAIEKGMAGDFIASVRKSISTLAKLNLKDPVAAEAQRVTMIKDLNNLGLSFGKDATIKELLDTPMGPKDVKALTDIFAATYGKAMTLTIRQDFGVLLENRRKFNKTASMAFGVSNAVYETLRTAYIEELVKSGDIAASKYGNAYHDLNAKQEKVLNERVFKVMPSLQTAMSNMEATASDTGMTVGKMSTEQQLSVAYKNQVGFGTRFGDTGADSLITHGSRRVRVDPSVKMAATSTHSFDSAISHMAMWLTKKYDQVKEILNLHDAHGVGIDQLVEAGRSMNESVWDNALQYSPSQEMYNSLMETLRGTEALLKDSSTPASVIDAIAKELVQQAADSGYYDHELQAKVAPLSPRAILIMRAREAKALAFQANSIKLGAMAQMGSIAQYAVEYGNFKVTQEHRDAAQAKLDALTEEMSEADMAVVNALADRLAPHIDALMLTFAQFEAQKAGPTPEVFGKLGTPKVTSDKALVEYFQDKPNRSIRDVMQMLKKQGLNNFQSKLVSQLDKTIGAGIDAITVNFITSGSNKTDALAPNKEDAHAWFVAKGDATAIYVLSPEFAVSGLTVETLIHEMLHAALARAIDTAEKESKGPAYELVAELELLRAAAAEFIKTNKLGKQYDAALVDVHELVSWGMTNQAFQDNVLKPMQMVSKNSKNVLLNGFKAFINTLVNMVFGRPNESMTTGMSALVINVAGLLNAAEQGYGTKADLVLSQAAPPSQNLRDMTTIDIFDALGGPSHNGRGVSAGFSAQLRDLLGTIIDKLHGPIGTLKADIMEQTAKSADEVYEEAIATGQVPFASESLSAGFAFTDQEAFVLDQVEATVRVAMEGKDGVMSAAYRELANLYTDVRAKVTPASFHDGDWATATTTEQANAKALYDFIFEVKVQADGRSDYLSRFAAMGMAHEGFNKLLQMATDKRGQTTADMPFNERLQKLVERILNWFAGRMTDTRDGQLADAKLATLVKQLVTIEVRKRSVLEAKNKLVGPVTDRMGDMNKAARAKLEAFGKLPFFQTSTSGFVRAAGSLTSAYAGDRMDAIMEGYQRFRDQHMKGQLGLAASLVNEMRGATATTMMYHFLLRATKHIEGRRQDLSSGTSNIVLGSFTNSGRDLNDDQKAALSAVILRTDVASLLADPTYDMVRLHKLLAADKTYLKQEAARLEAEIAGLNPRFKQDYIDAAKALGFFMATGKATTANVVMNAGNIARLYGTNLQNKVTEAEAIKAEKVLDQLVTMYAIGYSDSVDVKNALAVFDKENARTDGGHGIEHLVKTHAALQAESKDKLFDGSAALQMKGYLPSVYDPYMDVVVANEHDGAELLLKGYTPGATVAPDRADPTAEPRRIYHMRDGGMTRRVSGIISTTSMDTKGARIHSGDVSPISHAGQMNAVTMTTIKTRKAAMLAAARSSTGFDPTRVTDNHTVPVFNGAGDVVNYRYMMSEETKDKLLRRDNRPDKLLGAMAGNIYDKVESPKQNRRTVDALYQQYKAEFAERPESYLVVGPNSTDPQLREIWNLLPYDTKQAVKETWGTESMMVRNDVLDMNFGYRKLSVATAFNKEKAQRNFVEGMFVELMTHAFHEKAELRTRQVEDIWQAVVKVTKGNLVVRSWSTFSGNLRSNWSQLILMGVNPIAVAQGHRVAFKGAWSYKQDKARLFKLQHALDVGYLEAGQTVADIKHQITRLEDGIKRNPVTPLIEAGLMPTIVEDIEADDDIYSYKSIAVKKVERQTARFNPHVVGLGKFLLMTEDSTPYKMMAYGTQISDFLAKYTLYQHKVAKGMRHEDAIQLASEAFINYDVPTHRLMQYANDSGLMMFTKYYMRIQKMLAKIYKEHPGRVLAMIAAEVALGDQPTVMDSGMMKRWGNPFNLGALDYPGSLDSLMTVRVLTSPFRTAANPND